MSTDGQGTLRRRNIAENLNRLSRVHERYRQTDDRQTDGRAIAYSERELTRSLKMISILFCTPFTRLSIIIPLISYPYRVHVIL